MVSSCRANRSLAFCLRQETNNLLLWNHHEVCFMIVDPQIQLVIIIFHEEQVFFGHSPISGSTTTWASNSGSRPWPCLVKSLASWTWKIHPLSCLKKTLDISWVSWVPKKSFCMSISPTFDSSPPSSSTCAYHHEIISFRGLNAALPVWNGRFHSYRCMIFVSHISSIVLPYLMMMIIIIIIIIVIFYQWSWLIIIIII